eukprot:PhM_4_TR6236/c0_g1_i1/m.85384/K15289/SLC35F5; solute carrier family 35, member F5
MDVKHLSNTDETTGPTDDDVIGIKAEPHTCGVEVNSELREHDGDDVDDQDTISISDVGLRDEDEEEEVVERRRRRTAARLLGAGLIVLTAVIWVSASEWIQHIFGDLHYSKPFFLTYFNTMCFSVWNIGYAVSPRWRALAREGWRDRGTTMMSNDGVVDDDDQVVAVGDSGTRPPYGIERIVRGALCFCPLWFLANTLFNFSLARTSVASNTILSSTSSVWTLILGYLCLPKECDDTAATTSTSPIGCWRRIPLLYRRIVAVACSVGGAVLVGFGAPSKNGHSSTLLGNVLAVASAFFYGAYTTQLKRSLPDDDRYSMGMVFGAVGVWNTILFWPGLVVLHYTGVEPFEFPDPRTILWPLLVNTLVGTNLSDVLWARGVVLTSPVVATLGLSLTIPLAIVADIILGRSVTYSVVYVTGAVSVAVGFLMSNL